MTLQENTNSTERVRLSRWVNKAEDLADKLLEHLRTAPNPLPREPLIDPMLLHFLSDLTISEDDASEVDYPESRFLRLGNGNQVSNKKRALKAAENMIDGVTIIDRRTINWHPWGTCHFAAYTHPKGAMISAPSKEDYDFGSADWHKRDYISLFRDTGQGYCIVYICSIEPLFAMRTIGHHGVTWENIEKTATHKEKISSVDANKIVGH